MINWLSNEGRGDISFSYGVAVAYKISNRLSIRSGINKVDLSYNTRDVSYGTAISAMAVENNDARAVTLASPVMGNINQNLGFVEVPVELKYGVIDKKFGLNIIGGASTLFLSENNVTLEAGAATTSFGEAGNLNNVSYSANMGVGLDYNISSKFQINVEPIFKYQINTFNNTSDVKPYYFGVYSGLSFKF
ncbi:outer membrane beta-barrel protein [Antarcticibacterium sp. 1MA-6-2]|uniref:outer membrane beta-barrel protein n=1 Tax=Antarcticibacterium sp. 1MA-6-2 TaxID=2908210 RepID=UPI001F3F6634|nr:outer membrane beta-barrel protein [Antarcticibacterium sp. 1MA-6-2]UJH92617.1 outer membrane beta-barrel protein [Antarcticibacterium sp. 1MA-6-2]